MKQLRLMSGGAAQGLVGALRESFEREHACTVNGTFGAVGLMRDHLPERTFSVMVVEVVRRMGKVQ